MDFESERKVLLAEISVKLDNVLTNINMLNRSLEGSIAVGKDFESVSNLWSNIYEIPEISKNKQSEEKNEKVVNDDQKNNENENEMKIENENQKIKTEPEN